MWLTEFRRAYGLSIGQLDRLLRPVGAKRKQQISYTAILYRLENWKGFVTLPKIANVIAAGCGATAAQRDELVLEQYRGRWKGTGQAEIRLPKPTPRAAPRPTPPPARKGFVSPRGVVAVDADTGSVLGRYDTVTSAAVHFAACAETVRRCCALRQINHRIQPGAALAFRYADEWNAMTEAQRHNDLAGARKRPEAEGRREMSPEAMDRAARQHTRAVIAIARTGQELGRFSSLREAADATGETRQNICQRCRYTFNGSVFTRRGIAFMYLDEWENMSDARRKAWLGMGSK